MVDEGATLPTWHGQAYSQHEFIDVQVQGSGGREIQYSGTMDVINKTIEREGVRGLYKVWLCPSGNLE